VLIHMFLRSPDPAVPVSTVYRQAVPYGPAMDPGSGAVVFSDGWVFDVAASAPDAYRQLYAVTDGVIHVSRSGETTSLVLRPLPGSLRQLHGALGATVEVPSAFVYTHVDPAAVLEVFTPRVAAAPNPGELTLDERLGDLMNGFDGVLVKAGEGIGRPAAGPDPGWLLAGFEVVIRMDNGMDPLLPVLLDPVVFYTLIGSYAGPGAPLLAPVDRQNSILSLATPRRLLEVRTEYNTPYVGDIAIGHGTSPDEVIALSAAHRGHVQLPAGWPEYRLRVGGRRLTDVPTATSAPPTLTRTLTPPVHWVVQTVDPDDWFGDPMPPYHPGYALSKFTEGNLVTPLIDGIDTFEEMYGELRRIASPDHFVYLTAWWLDDDFPMVPGAPASSFGAICRDLDTRYGAKVRALVWSPLDVVSAITGVRGVDRIAASRWPNGRSVDHIEALANGHAILDARTRTREILPAFEPCVRPWIPAGYTALLVPFLGSVHPVGTHHQKLMVVNNRDGLVGFCGGVDIKCNRLQFPGHVLPPGALVPGCDEAGYHDVHCKVEGPAVADMLDTFRHRWNDHPAHPPGDTLAGSPPLRTPAVSQFVQVARTYPAGVYTFAPDGDRTIGSTLLQAILHARKYIYIEDQYLVALEVRDAILRVLDRIRHVTILLTEVSDFPQERYRRQQFIAPLRAAAPGKVRVYYPVHFAGDAIYEHSKVAIVDDIFALVGSACVDRRGYSHDGEITVGVLDARVSLGGRTFAKDLRMRLWAEHLGFLDPIAHRYLHLETFDDPVWSGQLWPTNPGTVREYHENDDVDVPGAVCRGVYEDIFDPDGSS
jgi:hypothetical protein